jgi:GDP-L-fucose synthase
MQKSSKTFVAGHNGLVGSALMRTLKKKGFSNLVYRSHSELDLTNQPAVERFFIKDELE